MYADSKHNDRARPTAGARTRLCGCAWAPSRGLHDGGSRSADVGTFAHHSPTGGYNPNQPPGHDDVDHYIDYNNNDNNTDVATH